MQGILSLMFSLSLTKGGEDWASLQNHPKGVNQHQEESSSQTEAPYPAHLESRRKKGQGLKHSRGSKDPDEIIL